MKVVEQFKRRILDLAIRGKLVPQDPNDEPASILLERIKAEKAKLVKAGKIKKEKNPSEIVVGSDGAAYEKFGRGDLSHAEARRRGVDVPFDLPQGWAWARLGEVGSWKAGATPSRKVADYYVGGVIPWLKTGDLNDGVVTYIPESITEKAIAETSVRLNPVGTVLIAMYGATIGRIGLLGIAATTNQACCACIVERQIYNRYLFFYLMAQREHFRSLGGGGAQPNISKDIITSYPFPVPPLAEQRRIVAKIDELFTIVDSMGNAADGLSFAAKRLDKKILDLAIRGRLVPQDPNDEPASELVKRIAASHKSPCKNQSEPIDPPFAIPQSWEWMRLGDILHPMTSKKPTGETFDYIDIDAIDNKQHIVKVAKTLQTKGATSRASREVKSGDVLFSMVRPYLRNIALIDEGYAHCIASTGFYVCRPSDVLYPPYLYHLMLSDYVVMGLNESMKGLNSPGITTGDLQRFPIPLPPLAEQKRIVAKVEDLRAVIKSLTT